jgi:hypothetical protein
MITDIAGRLLLFSLPHKVVIWNYQFDGSSRAHIVLGHLLYSASTGMGERSMLAVGATPLPGPSVNETIASLDPNSLMILKPGAAVRLDVRVGEHNDRVKAALERKIEANGWKLDPASPVTLVAEITSESKQVTYEQISGLGYGSQKTVTATTYRSCVSVNLDNKLAWSSASFTGGATPHVMAKSGEELQSKIDEMQKPNAGFFDQVKIPDRILHPDKKYGMGTTMVTTRGLVPKEPQAAQP